MTLGNNYDRQGRLISFEQWGRLLVTDEYKRVGLDRYGDITVSTVWLGINHRYGPGKPLIFETMTFAPEGSAYEDGCIRYATEAEAIMGHRRTCYNVENNQALWFEEESSA
jgi:hypothetical protein